MDLVPIKLVERSSGASVEVTRFDPDGSVLYAVRNPFGECLSRNGEWEFEVSPSSRDDAFLQRCRWDDFDEAADALEQALAREAALSSEVASGN